MKYEHMVQRCDKKGIKSRINLDFNNLSKESATVAFINRVHHTQNKIKMVHASRMSYVSMSTKCKSLCSCHTKIKSLTEANV